MSPVRDGSKLAPKKRRPKINTPNVLKLSTIGTGMQKAVQTQPMIKRISLDLLVL
jgi:hypothetical protein